MQFAFFYHPDWVKIQNFVTIFICSKRKRRERRLLSFIIFVYLIFATLRALIIIFICSVCIAQIVVAIAIVKRDLLNWIFISRINHRRIYNYLSYPVYRTVGMKMPSNALNAFSFFIWISSYFFFFFFAIEDSIIQLCCECLCTVRIRIVILCILWFRFSLSRPPAWQQRDVHSKERKGETK